MRRKLRHIATLAFLLGPVASAVLVFATIELLGNNQGDRWLSPLQFFSRIVGSSLVQAIFAAAFGWVFYSKFRFNEERYLGVGTTRHMFWGALVFLLSGVTAAIAVALAVDYPQFQKTFGTAWLAYMLFFSYGGLTLVFGAMTGVVAAKLGNNAF